MPDEAAPDHTALVHALLERLREADQKLPTDSHAAVRDALQVVLAFIIDVSRANAPGGVPRVVPGKAIARFVAALDDHDRGVPNPLLKPKPADAHTRRALPLTTKLARAEIGILMDMLMRADRTWEAAAKEVARLLGPNHAIFRGLAGQRWRIITHWRSDAMSGADPDIKKMFDESLDEATCLLRDQGAGAADLIQRAHRRLREFHYA
jgi:hypothetical protein